MTSQEFQAGQLVAYMDALERLEEMRKGCSPSSTEATALLVAEHRIASAAVEATR